MAARFGSSTAEILDACDIHSTEAFRPTSFRLAPAGNAASLGWGPSGLVGSVLALLLPSFARRVRKAASRSPAGRLSPSSTYNSDPAKTCLPPTR